jgi:hypothetical protein
MVYIPLYVWGISLIPKVDHKKGIYSIKSKVVDCAINAFLSFLNKDLNMIRLQRINLKNHLMKHFNHFRIKLGSCMI